MSQTFKSDLRVDQVLLDGR